MPGVYQALPSAGLSLPELQHLIDSLPSHHQKADLKNWVAGTEMGTMEMRMKNKVVILVTEILTDPVTIRLMIMVLVTIMTMKIPMMMGISQTLLMLSQH